MFGFISQESINRGHSTCLYRDKNGKITEISLVSDDPEYVCGWPDAVALGEVGEFHSRGRPDTTGVIRGELEPFTIKRISESNYQARVRKTLAVLCESDMIIACCDDDVQPDVIVESN